MNERASAQIRAKFTAPRGVAISQRPVTQAHNDFLTLVHELAHIRFELFLQNRLRKGEGTRLHRIARRLPDSLAYFDSDGRLHVHQQLLDLFHERYAHELEFRAYLATRDRYYEATIPKFYAVVNEP